MKNYVLHQNKERRTKNLSHPTGRSGQSELCSLEAATIHRSSFIVHYSATERSF